MSGSTKMNLAGGCACGAVRFEIAGPVRPVIACHCETCRRTSGHYWAATAAYREDLLLVEERGLRWFRSSAFARRGFCAECGSSLLYHRDGADRISVAAGSLDAPTGLRLVEQICTAQAGDYYALDEAPPQQAGNVISPRWTLPPK